MITLKNVYAGYNGRKILKNINLEITPGESLSIIGPNGSGKSTLLKVLAGLIPYEGSVKLNGVELNTLTHRKLAAELSLMEQTNPVAFSYSVYETVLIGRYRFSKSGFFTSWNSEDHLSVERCLKDLGLWELRKRSIKTLSGGQLQLVHFARTLIQDTAALLLDEPTNHLDLKYQSELVNQLKLWKEKKNSTLIGVFHDINIALDLSEKLLLLCDGEIAKIGSASQVLGSKELNQVYNTDIISYMVRNYERWIGFKSH